MKWAFAANHEKIGNNFYFILIHKKKYIYIFYSVKVNSQIPRPQP